MPPLPFLSRFQEVFQDHAASWGLRRFFTEPEYYQWQREALPAQQLSALNDLANKRQGNPDPKVDSDFYDFVADPGLLPVLYSQRYGYYQDVGAMVAIRLPTAATVLDFGCGVGILTTLYARLFPDTKFLGIDRSSQSIQAGRDYVALNRLGNVHFKWHTLPGDAPLGKFDIIIATQALFQSERDPGLPSRSWDTFERDREAQIQVAAEQRTGIGERLDGLLPCLHPEGRLILFEKAQHLGRRILLQRALATRGVHMVEDPVFLTYDSLGETERDGPLYVLSRVTQPGKRVWNEAPEVTIPERLYGCRGEVAMHLRGRLPNPHHQRTRNWTRESGEEVCLEIGQAADCLAFGFIRTTSGFMGILVGSLRDEEAIHQTFDTFIQGFEGVQDWNSAWTGVCPSSPVDDPANLPLFENHTPYAQEVWSSLPGRQIQHSDTSRESDGRQRHIELGTCAELVYVYWANSYDQRQLVVMERERGHLLDQYYLESIREASQ